MAAYLVEHVKIKKEAPHAHRERRHISSPPEQFQHHARRGGHVLAELIGLVVELPVERVLCAEASHLRVGWQGRGARGVLGHGEGPRGKMLSPPPSRMCGGFPLHAVVPRNLGKWLQIYTASAKRLLKSANICKYLGT